MNKDIHIQQKSVITHYTQLYYSFTIKLSTIHFTIKKEAIIKKYSVHIFLFLTIHHFRLHFILDCFFLFYISVCFNLISLFYSFNNQNVETRILIISFVPPYINKFHFDGLNYWVNLSAIKF